MLSESVGSDNSSVQCSNVCTDCCDCDQVVPCGTLLAIVLLKEMFRGRSPGHECVLYVTGIVQLLTLTFSAVELKFSRHSVAKV
jgi:hypothetical protein